MKKILSLTLAALLLLGFMGCTQQELPLETSPPVTESTGTPQTTAPPETTVPATDPTEVETTQSTEPSEVTDPTESTEATEGTEPTQPQKPKENTGKQDDETKPTDPPATEPTQPATEPADPPATQPPETIHPKPSLPKRSLWKHSHQPRNLPLQNHPQHSPQNQLLPSLPDASMTGCASIMTRNVTGEPESCATAAGRCMEIPMNWSLCGMPTPPPTRQQNPCSTMAVSDAWMSGSWTSPPMTNGYAVIAENQNHKTYLIVPPGELQKCSHQGVLFPFP